MNFYNENDPYAAQWLRNLIQAGHIVPGYVCERSIKEVTEWEIPDEQAHFFAGIGVWSYALRLAGWPDSVPIWTGSCPCQPFSQAGRRKGNADDRHLWPDWFKLIEKCHPPIVLGEQVAGPDGLRWLDSVFADLEGAGYTVAAADTCAAGVGAPHLRQRLYFMAYSKQYQRGQIGAEPRRREIGGSAKGLEQRLGDGSTGGLADRERAGLARPLGQDVQKRGTRPTESESVGALGDDDDARPQGRIVGGYSPGERASRAAGLVDPWESDWLWCRDKKYRPVGPGTFPLAHGATSRMGRVRAYGNALVAQQAAQFVMAAMETLSLMDLIC